MTTKLTEMWAALEAHEPAPEYAETWATMLKERTEEAAWAAYRAAPAGSAAEAAAWAAYTAAGVAAWAAARASDCHAQEAIDAIKEMKP
jgi:hypothetical protein